MTKNPRTFLALTVVTPLLCAGQWRGERIAFQPKAGSALTKTIEIEGSLELEEMKLEVDGNDLSEMAGQMEQTMAHSQKLVVTDTYAAVEDGRPKKLERRFDEISSKTHTSGSTGMGPGGEFDVELESDLEGRRVVFTQEGGYQIAFAEGEEGDKALLDGLEEDLDLRGFLPESEVAEGASWKLEGEALKAILVPGGDLSLKPVDDSAAMGMETASPSDMLSQLEGTFEATYRGTRDEDGTKVAVIHLALDGTSANDLTEKMQAMGDKIGEKLPGAKMELKSFDGEYEYEAEGELLWNLETGLVHGLTLSGELRMIMDVSMTVSMGAKSQTMDLSQTYAGSQTLTLTTDS